VLVCKEQYLGKDLLKFPGGGLEFGEGLLECLHREWKEELDISIRIVRHVYTTEDFVQSVFDQNDQLLSVYALTFPIDQIVLKNLVKETI